ncbi:MAG: D-cysteine desulfhydrase family protein, partial [Anaerolineae bacterium]
MVDEPARVSLGYFPTPLDALPRLSEALGGPHLYVKRDDMTGLATGGNKTRKLEYLMADALEQEADTVITCGAAQSNHARQTAAAAARCGLQSVLVLGPMAPPETTGNLLIDDLVGARVRWAGDRDRAEVMEEVADEERAAGRTPYVVPYGGSNAIGASAYVDAFEEVTRQLLERHLQMDHVVLASSSGGTQAGMVTGARAVNFRGRVLGISVAEKQETLRRTILELTEEIKAHLDLRFDIDPDTVRVNDEYLDEGYGIMGEVEREAIRLVARTEGLLLDPVYTGRAMAGLLDLIDKG